MDVGTSGCIAAPNLTQHEVRSMQALVPAAKNTLSEQLETYRKIILARLWPVSTTVTVSFNRVEFIDEIDQQNIETWVQGAFQELPITFRFIGITEENNVGQIRVQFVYSEGNWSYIGNEALKHTNPDTSTMNIREYKNKGNVLHVFGHAFGLTHQQVYDPDLPVMNASVIWSTMNGPGFYWSYEKTQNSYIDIYNTNRLFEGDTLNDDSLMQNYIPPHFWQSPDMQHFQSNIMNRNIPQEFSEQDLIAMRTLMYDGKEKQMDLILSDVQLDNTIPTPTSITKTTTTTRSTTKQTDLTLHSQVNPWPLTVGLSLAALTLILSTVHLIRRSR
jgi:hypothetical protein